MFREEFLQGIKYYFELPSMDLLLNGSFAVDQETLAGQILMERALMAKSDAEYFAVLSELKTAPLEKRIQFVQGLGDRLVQNSDDDKLEQTGQPAADGVSGAVK